MLEEASDSSAEKLMSITEPELSLLLHRGVFSGCDFTLVAE